MLGSIIYAIKQAFSQVFRNRAMSTASMFSITSMLLILGLFFILLVNVNMVAESAKGQFDSIQIYLQDSTNREEADIIISDLKKKKEVADAYYLSKVDALENWKGKWGENAYLLDGLNQNPLPNTIVVTLSDLEFADKVANDIKSFEGIEDIKYYKTAVDQLMKITKYIQMAAMVIIIFLVAVSVVVVSNTVKLTVLAREREISIMKYVGATNWFIRGPFLVEGMLIGLFSALISSGIISLIYYKTVELIGPGIFAMMATPLVPQEFLVINLVWIFMALGVSIGAFGSIVSMRRFLDT